MPVCLGDFVDKAVPISAALPLSRVVELFLNDPDAHYFILVRDKRPAGMVGRSLAFEFAASTGLEQQSKLAIGDLITARALILKSETTIETFIRKAGKQIETVLARGCIVVEGKRFKGVLSPAKLQEALVAAYAEVAPADKVSAPSLVAAQNSPILGTLAHEIRTPLTAIMGLSEMLATRIHDEYEKDIAQTIVRSSQTLDRILTDTLDYAKLEAGRLKVRSEAADLTELAEDLRRLWGTEASRRGLALRVGFIPDGPHFVQTDLGRVRQIASNLISNALKFTREGEVDVTLSTQTLTGVTMLTLSVADTGRGFERAATRAFHESIRDRS